MTLEEFLLNYGGNACISIDGYCEEETYDFFHDVEDWELSDDNPNHYKPTCQMHTTFTKNSADSKMIGLSIHWSGQPLINLGKGQLRNGCPFLMC